VSLFFANDNLTLEQNVCKEVRREPIDSGEARLFQRPRTRVGSRSFSRLCAKLLNVLVSDRENASVSLGVDQRLIRPELPERADNLRIRQDQDHRLRLHEFLAGHTRE
jgi:hypothetical protein